MGGVDERRKADWQEHQEAVQPVKKQAVKPPASTTASRPRIIHPPPISKSSPVSPVSPPSHLSSTACAACCSLRLVTTSESTLQRARSP